MKKLKGKEFWIKWHERKSCSDCSPDTSRVFWGDMVADLNDRFMPGRLAKLLPTPYCTAKPMDWYPFLVAAIAMGWAKPIIK